MGEYILTITAIFQILVFAIICYYLFLGIAGLFRKEEKKNYKPKNKFAMLIAAHNEEVVIGSLIESMMKLDYPKEMYDVFVIADNCTDNTAKIAKGYGVNVCERFSKDKRGKGYALEWMFSKLFAMEKQYDAIAIFDADNLVHKDFLKEMNSKMQEGYKVVQGYIDSKNPEDSWIASSYSIGFWTQNRMNQLAKANLGLTSQIGGTGFVLETNTLKKLGWGATCLTEDLEFTCKLVLNGEKVGWAHDAIIYDEKPLKLKQSWSQRKRWMQGFTDVASRYFFKLLKKAVLERKFYIFDCALYVLQPFVTVLIGISTILTLIQSNTSGVNIFIINYLFSDDAFKAFCVIQFLLTPLTLLIDKKISKQFMLMEILYSSNVFVVPYLATNTRDWLVALAISIGYNLAFLVLTGILLGKKQFVLFYRFWLYGLYTITWFPISIQGILNKNNKEWSHTKHVRKIEICDV
ncbi:glycosyltransferase family 2 protein [Clostridium saccharoperbutylacetonicum]|uniref:glycosyltransferase family 2 protein n=1 Tax=Clostridium saccharoperbutylacetonicum TaxID=36745 RepID=UPI000983AA6C|nr:glycosyltransferase family 2 protein [Clostridium saccharoperbutylacetonicum]AQR97052.1 beta-monoglucosyldiacylglycerol synthase [Clostridium saccharoperbutylacetonicum]NSB32932.1 cellulose synthase/poly-beta-1,6-N-acetylglucosamine synthase-like glycosyltransferase [Clostridium saccharoperbutylacetonicum]